MSATCLTVAVGHEHYALDVEQVLEIAELGELTPVPGAAEAVRGVCNVRGEVLPVLDLARLFGLGVGTSAARMIVIDDAGKRSGLAVDEVLDVGPSPVLTEHADTPLLRGAALVEGTLVGMIDLAALLSAAQLGA